MVLSIVNFKHLANQKLNSRYIISKVLFNCRRLATMSNLLDKVPDVDIDEHGKFKYILINVYDDTNNVSKSIVRGYARAQYHANIFDEVGVELEAFPGLRAKCLGGGRIEHDPDERTIKVYGYSQGFGKADHEVSAGILEKRYPDYTITCSDDGY